MLRSIAKFEKKSGILRLILFLSESGEIMLSSIWPDSGISVHQGYDALESLKELGIAKARIDNSRYPPKHMISLTSKGVEIAQKLKEIEIILAK